MGLLGVLVIMAAEASAPVLRPPVVAPPPPLAPYERPAPMRAVGRAWPAVLRNSQYGWITSDDYPARALRGEEAGTVAFRLDIGLDGVPTACHLVRSSGFADLDEATCPPVMRRARFWPALDKDGSAVAGTYEHRVRWALAGVRDLPRPALRIEREVIEADGSLSHCELLRDDDPAYIEKPMLGPHPCDETRGPAYRDAAGQPVRKRVTVTHSITVDDAPAETAAQ